MADTHCPICNDAMDPPGDLDHYICSSCGCHFSYYDHAGGNENKRKELHEEWREQWLANDKKPLNEEQIIALVKKVMGNVVYL